MNDWKNSETFCLGNQKKLLFVDNRTEEYEKSSHKDRLKLSKFCWKLN